jgi:peptide/nickel transport system permease protein
MARYFFRRVLISIPVLLGISLVLFTILALAPGDPFEELATNPNVPREVAQQLRAKFGLDDPIYVRYTRWFVSMVKGDWGFSFVSRVNVDTLILQRLPTTLWVIGSAQLLGILIALPIGIYSAVRPYSLFDQIATTLAFIGFSLPTFFTGIVFILVFSIYFDWLPFIYQSDISASGWQWVTAHLKQSIMPVAVLGLFQAASLMRFTRSAVLDVVRLDYVNTARAKGLSEWVTIVKHVVRNALIPVVTLVALQLPNIVTGAVITEQIFRVPGIGALLIASILANDTPVVMAITFVASALVVLASIVADLIYAWLDPRISYAGGGAR